MRARLELPADLEPLRASIEGSIAPSIVLSPADRDETARTRFGGAPLLAPGVEWPRSDRGPLSFLGQLDFRELRGFGGDGLVLPTDGVLTFFYDVEEQPWGYDPSHASGWALRYAADSASAIDVESPRGAIPFDEEPLVPTAAPSLPWPGDLALRAFGAGDHPEQAPWARAYRELVATFAAANAPPLAIGPSRQQVGGYAEWLDGDGRLTAELASSGVSADRGRYRASDLRRAENGASEWQLLWQLEPHDDRFTWVDLGTLYILVRRADLAARRFDRSWVVFQAG